MTKSDRRHSTENEPVDQLQHLRDLVLGPTRHALEELRQDLQDKQVDAEGLSQILPEAITRSTASGPGLAKSMGPTISAAFEESVKRDPKKLADAVSPIMGPAIQRYIQQQIQAMVQSLNTAIDHSLSPKSIRWRFEAWRTGKPFAEVVLLHTLIYRIEQVMLIDPDTGILMQSVSSNKSDDDADLVSSLLTAIQDFMRESFRHRSEAGSDLQEIHTNELKVWVQHGSSAVLAVAIRGEPPLALRQKIQSLLNQLHINHGSLLADFQGDTAPLELVRPDLEALLESEFIGRKKADKSESKKQEQAESPWAKLQLKWVLPTVMIMLLIGWNWQRRRDQYQQYLADELDLPATAQLSLDDNIVRIEGLARQAWIEDVENRFERFANLHLLDLAVEPSDREWVDYLADLRAEPGITVVQAKLIGNRYHVAGWRDPDSVDPNDILASSELEETRVEQQWDLFRSSDPRIILKRLKANIEFPKGVSAHYEVGSDKVFVQGVVSKSWLDELQRVVQVCQFDEGALDLRLLFQEDQAAR